MAAPATPAQDQIREDVAALLAAVYDSIPEWNRELVEDVVMSYGADGETFSANDFRHLLPEAAHGHVGAVLRSLATRRPAVIVPVGEVRSTASSTHGKPIKVWRLAETSGARASR
ncbi:hypothetical protein ABH935_009799 [Catenulispora sp. GAS73]|uniref:hypothetical protein n=1 Tax=Catenulispora sp. GAS73 TaxID=3156269 RepID=UPI003512B8C2